MFRKKQFLVVFTLLLSGAANAESGTFLTLLVEENFPHATQNEETGDIEGVEVDIILSLMSEANVPYSMSIQPWNRAFRRTATEKDTCLFPINHTPERAKLFEWVSPTQRGGWAFYQRPDSNIVINALEDVAPHAIVGKAGIQATSQIKEQTGVVVLEAATDIAAAQLLYRGRADLLISGVHDSIVATRKAGLPDLKMAFYWKPAQFGLACNLETDPDTLRALRLANTNRLSAAR